MRILVTGGAGFIGSNLIHHLLELGGDVLVVDNLSTGKVENLDPRAGFRKLDILDERFLNVCREFAPEVIVHLAAQPSVAESVRNPEHTFDVNVAGTRLVAEAARECGAERMVFASTAAVYGNPAELPLKEISPTAPINPYGESKLQAERCIEDTLRPAGVDFAIFRFSNVYGPRQDALGEGGVVSIFCSTLADKKTPVIYGDGKQVRDFIYVADLVNALTSAIGGDIQFSQDTNRAKAPGVYNISTGQPATIDEVLMNLRMGAEFYGAPEYGPEREGDIRESILDPSKALEVFDWKANIGLDKGLEATWTWFLAHKSPLAK